MDPLTHALLGATAAQALFGRRLGEKFGSADVAKESKSGFSHRAWMLGAVGGLLPDADILIRSATDPLLAIEYHRQFTHSFAFVPIGGLIAATPWLLRAKHRVNWLPVVGAATIGYASHGLLDACTNYGTQLLWPFLSLRVAWNWVTTIGPPLTLALLIGLVIAVRSKSRLPAALALLFGFAYVGSAAWQREQALTVQAAIAELRGHKVDRGEMFPSVGNMLVWRSVYESGGTLYSDRVRVVGSNLQWKPGSSVKLLTEQDLPPQQRADAGLMRDFRRFTVFSSGWVARPAVSSDGKDIQDADMIGDARYSLRTDAFLPIWGVRFHPGAAQPTEWVDRTAKNRVPVKELWAEIKGEAPDYRRLSKR